MLFASLALDREPLQWSQLPQALLLWTQNVGGVATLGLGLWLLARFLQQEPVLHFSSAVSPAKRGRLTTLFVIGAFVGLIGNGLIVLTWVLSLTPRFSGLAQRLPRSQTGQELTAGDWIMAISGACAVATVLAPILWSAVASMRGQRIWALARLSLKEAVRGRIIWVFGAMALVFLFADWFVSYKPEDQVRNYVRVIYWSMTPLFLLTAALLGAFSIPTDIKNNSIHTIVTKPVERFEVVLGRFLGYGILLTAGLGVIACLSLVYVVRGVNEEAKNESYKARVVVYGKLDFAGTKNAQRGENVGREWSYRSYITGPTSRKPDALRQYAVWTFPRVPDDLGQRDEPVRFEFSFDIFRLSKGEEGVGVPCTFTFVDGTFNPGQLPTKLEEMRQEKNRLLEQAIRARDKIERSPDADQKKQAQETYEQRKQAIDKEVTRKYRLFQVPKEVYDYHTLSVAVPPWVFAILLDNPSGRNLLDGEPAPMLRVLMNVNIAPEAQMVGVAQQDFYLLAYERPFWQNFLKGLVGLWCTTLLVLGVAIACSTYLSSVIALLCTLFLYGAGISLDYLHEVASGKLDGGGPLESGLRVSQQMPLALKLEESPTTTVVQLVDQVLSWWIGRVMNLVPDINRHDLHQYVANGFDISLLDVLLADNVLPLFGYLLPWAVLAYYLMKYREIANPS